MNQQARAKGAAYVRENWDAWLAHHKERPRHDARRWFATRALTVAGHPSTADDVRDGMLEELDRRGVR
jgi:hypothetical protein